MAIQWTPALSVGVEEIDAQHRELFQRAARFLEAMQAKKAKKAKELGGLLEYLHLYAVEHFGLEEELMRERKFPGYLRHKAEHDRFVKDLLALADEHQKKGAHAFVATRASKWLASWLKEHVSGTDAELGRFLAKRAG
jgi:hemerythrin